VRRRITGISAVATAALVLAACAGDYQYVKSSEDKTYFKVPARWTLYDESDVIDGLGVDLTENERQTELEQGWRVAFDAAPKPSLDHLGRAGADHPSGLAVVRNLAFEVADIISTEALRNYFFDIDTALQGGTGELLEYEELQLDGGFRGIHFVASLEMNGKRMTIDQTMLLDQATTKLYALIVSCSNVCYEDNRREIKSVVDSWTVRAQ